MSNGLQLLDIRTESNTVEGTPEQYAINVVDEKTRKTAKTLVKKSEEIIKAAIIPNTEQISFQKSHPIKAKGDFINDFTQKKTTASEHTPPASVSHGEPSQKAEPPKQEQSGQGRTANKPTRFRKPDSPPVQQSAEIGIKTRDIEPVTYSLQSQGPGLALVEETGTGLQMAQAAGQATETGSSAAASAAGPVVIAYQTTEKAVNKIKETVENITVRAQSSKNTLGALAAFFLMPILILLAVAGALRGGGFASNVNLSADVLALMPQINAACQAHGIPEYAALVAAVMMQESGGNVEATHGDVMQCAESLGYPAGTPVPVEESINHGVGVLAHKLSAAGATGPTDIPAISLALQAYNYGDGYFSWARSHGGGYSKENALSFQQHQMSHGYPGGYGDANYVDHVLRYYQVGSGNVGDVSAIANGAFAYPCAGHSWITYAGHEGIDIQAGVGEPVYACAAGTVTYAQPSWHSGMGYDGIASYGNCIFIDHGNGWQTRYAHMSSIAVASGTVVQQGQLIGYVGSTGNSSGPHMHLALYYNGSPSSGGVIYAEQAWPQYKQ